VCRTVSDLAKTTEGVMTLEVEHNKLNVLFNVDENLRVSAFFSKSGGKDPTGHLYAALSLGLANTCCFS